MEWIMIVKFNVDPTEIEVHFRPNRLEATSIESRNRKH